MGIFNGCLLACDIDGTLMINGNINQKNIEAIDFFVKEGGHFSLSTGRTVGAVKTVTSVIKDISPSVVSNGSMVYDFSKREILYEKCLQKEDYYIVEKILNLNLDIAIEIHTAEKIILLHENREEIDHREYERFSVERLSYSEACEYNWDKVLYLFSRKEDIAIVKKVIGENSFKSCYFVDTTVTLGGRKREYYEQVPLGVSKASALDILCEKLKVKNGCLFAIGDYYNDFEMIKNADIGAALCDSPDDIKKAADYITVKCDDGAVADFIGYLYNKRKEG
ncbi:MAG: HAD-IIB family hydrolase [Clostridia bacterium]|nr:HAD-IIB family hydrolase [Clostridia bacterium]